jgi:hypothetical protein
VNIAHLLNQVVYVAACTSGPDADGKFSYASPAPRACRMERGEGLERGQDGTTLRTPAKLVTLTAIGPRDRVWPVGVVPASASEVGFRLPAAGGSTPAVDLGGVIQWYETEV